MFDLKLRTLSNKCLFNINLEIDYKMGSVVRSVAIMNWHSPFTKKVSIENIDRIRRLIKNVKMDSKLFVCKNKGLKCYFTLIGILLFTKKS